MLRIMYSLFFGRSIIAHGAVAVLGQIFNKRCNMMYKPGHVNGFESEASDLDDLPSTSSWRWFASSYAWCFSVQDYACCFRSSDIVAKDRDRQRKRLSRVAETADQAKQRKLNDASHKKLDTVVTQ